LSLRALEHLLEFLFVGGELPLEGVPVEPIRGSPHGQAPIRHGKAPDHREGAADEGSVGMDPAAPDAFGRLLVVDAPVQAELVGRDPDRVPRSQERENNIDGKKVDLRRVEIEAVQTPARAVEEGLAAAAASRALPLSHPGLAVV
jgi:hypothetical protein